MSPSGWSQRWDSNPHESALEADAFSRVWADRVSHFRHAGKVVGSRGFEPRSARSERAASADCATSRRCGDHGRIRTATGQALDLLPLPGWATWPLVPPGGLKPPPHGLRTRRAALTPRRGIGADPGDRTRTTAIPGPQPAATSDQRWSEWRDSNPHLKAWKARRQPLPHIRPGSASGINR